MAPSIESAPAQRLHFPHKTSHIHPYAPLSAEEITHASSLLTAQWPEGTDIHYKLVTLAEPPKIEALPYLDAEASKKPLPLVDRKAFISYYLRRTNKLHEAVVNLTTSRTESNVRLGENVHGSGDAEEIIAMERIALEDEAVKREVERLRLPEGAVVVCDPWIYGLLRLQSERSGLILNLEYRLRWCR